MYGGKGEGASGNADINKLTFPPLCSVGSYHTPSTGSEDWGSDEQWMGKGNDWTADSGIWLGLHAVTKRKQPTYSKTEDFDAAIHHSMSWKGPEVVKKNIYPGVPRETTVQWHQRENTTQETVRCCTNQRMPSAGGLQRRGYEHCNKFDILQKDEEEDDDGPWDLGPIAVHSGRDPSFPLYFGVKTPLAPKLNECVECNLGESPERKAKKSILKQLSTIQKAMKQEKTVAACSEKKRGWQCLSVAVDSGACDNVIDPKDINAYEDQVEDTEASRNEEHFLAANGEEIPNYGQVKVPAITREQTVRGITFQAAGVSKGLLSVEKMNECGHVVIFDGDASFIVNKKTGEVNQLRRQDGNFMLDLWIPPPEVAQTLGFTWRP